MVIGQGPWGLEESKDHPYLQEGQEEESGELQTGQPHSIPREGDEANFPNVLGTRRWLGAVRMDDLYKW